MPLSQNAGFPVDASNNGGAPTLSITPVNIGDVIPMGIFIDSSGNSVTSVSSSNVKWPASAAIVNNNATLGIHMEIWIGVAISTATAAITVNWSGSNTVFNEWVVDSWTGNNGGIWTIGNTNSANQNTATTTVASPSITTHKASLIGFFIYGVAGVGNITDTNGTPTGYLYHTTATGNYGGTGLNLASNATTHGTFATTSSQESIASGVEIYVVTTGLLDFMTASVMRM